MIFDFKYYTLVICVCTSLSYKIDIIKEMCYN